MECGLRVLIRSKRSHVTKTMLALIGSVVAAGHEFARRGLAQRAVWMIFIVVLTPRFDSVAMGERFLIKISRVQNFNSEECSAGAQF